MMMAKYNNFPFFIYIIKNDRYIIKLSFVRDHVSYHALICKDFQRQDLTIEKSLEMLEKYLRTLQYMLNQITMNNIDEEYFPKLMEAIQKRTKTKTLDDEYVKEFSMVLNNTIQKALVQFADQFVIKTISVIL